MDVDDRNSFTVLLEIRIAPNQKQTYCVTLLCHSCVFIGRTCNSTYCRNIHILVFMTVPFAQDRAKV